MSDIIKLLPDSVANQIAAGEVIQRPASVIKELVENAVDAGASEINIVIRDAGRTLIQVVDNGCGMSPTDARMAFERHATSKIRSAEDLFALHTMGFRGEALPSICAIAQIELKTMAGEDAGATSASLGTRLLINGSRVESQEACVCTPGTNIMVKNLFYNVPARRKFLKSDSVELANIIREFERLALVNNRLRLTLDTGSKHIDLRPGSFKQRISDLWKGSLAQHLIPVEVQTGIVSISGFVTRPEGARRRQPLQYLIVNGRNMRHPYFHKAIIQCFEGMIAADTQPCYFLKFEVDPASLDINIHPTKNEIKFEEEANIRPILTAAIRTSLGKYAAGPDIDFSADMLPFDPARQGQFVDAPQDGVNSSYNPFDTLGKSIYSHSVWGGGSYKPKPPVTSWEKLYQDFTSATVPEEKPEPELPGMEKPTGALQCLQYADKYIITNSSDGNLLVIDQYRAHVKVLFQRFAARAKDRGVSMQRMMFPQSLALDADQDTILRGILPHLHKLGFLIEEHGQRRWEISGTPARLSTADAAKTILEIIAEASQDDDHAIILGTHDMLSRMALVMARAAAIRGGRTLSEAEMERLVNDLFQLPDPQYTPDGKQTFRIYSEHELAF